MTNKKFYIAVGVVAAAIIIASILMSRRGVQQTAYSVQYASEMKKMRDDYTMLVVREMKLRDTIYLLNKSIDRSIKNLDIIESKYWQEKNRVRSLASDLACSYLQSYVGDTFKIHRIKLDGSKVVVMSDLQLGEVNGFIVDKNYLGMQYDSARSIIYKLKDDVAIYNDLVSIKDQQVINLNSQIKTKDINMAKLSDDIECLRKDIKRQKRRSFFSGLGIGVVAGFIGTLFVL